MHRSPFKSEHIQLPLWAWHLVFVPMLLNYMLPILVGTGKMRSGGWVRDEVKRGGWEKGERGLSNSGGGGPQATLVDGEPPPPSATSTSLPPSLLLPSLSPDNLCKVADETHSHSRRPDCQNKLAFLWKVIDRLKGYKLGACSSFLLRSWGLFAADSPRPKIKWTQAGMNGRALIE